MPGLGKIVTTRYGKTRGGNNRGWLHGTSLGTRPIAGFPGLRLIARVDHPKDERLVGEIIDHVGKEKQAVFSPYTVTSFLRGSHHIHSSDEEAVERGQAQVALLSEAIAAMQRWPFMQPAILRLLSIQLSLLGERLMQADTALRLAAGERVETYGGFTDSLNRRNPLIAQGQFRVSARAIADQVQKDLAYIRAALQRIDTAADLWQAVNDEVGEVLELPADVSTEHLLWALHKLQLKPFSFAVSRVRYLQATQPGVTAAELRTTARQSLVAEQILAGMEYTMAEIKHHPQDFDRLPLLAVGQYGFSDMSAFDNAVYHKLVQRVTDNYGAMAAAFRDHNFDFITKTAAGTQKFLRYRRGEVWNQPHYEIRNRQAVVA